MNAFFDGTQKFQILQFSTDRPNGNDAMTFFIGKFAITNNLAGFILIFK